MSFDLPYERKPFSPTPNGVLRRGAGNGSRAGEIAAASTPADFSFSDGQALDAATRSSMEPLFGRDFGHVRVHAGPRAAESARGLDALAYASSPHLVFGAGQYAPHSARGRELLAHELAHVSQQDIGRERGGGARDAALLERDADAAAQRVLHGSAAEVGHAAAHDAGALCQAAPAAPAAPARRAREERFNVGRGGHRMDAELDRSIGWLTAKVKVRFNAVNNLLPWPSPARFAQFQTDFIQAVTRRWSFKHFLAPATSCADEPQRVAVRVQVIPVTSNPHFTVNVGYTDRFRTSSVGGRTATLDSQDNAVRDDQPQTPSEHEFGHMLGLPHIHCGRNDDECYGTTSDERADILGLGSYVSPRDYEPFAELMSYFTGCNYRVQQASSVPTSRGPDIGGVIGGLVGGLGLGAAGLAIGSALGPIGAAVGGLIGLVGGAIGGFFAGRAIGTPRVPS